MNDNQFNQGGMGVPPVNNNPQGGMGVPPVQPMPQPMPQPMGQPMGQPMPGAQPMPQPMGQAGFNPGMVPQKKKNPVLFIILGVVAAIIVFIVLWNVVLTKSFTCTSEIYGMDMEITVKSRFDKIVNVKMSYTNEFDSASDASDAYDELEDKDLCEEYGNGCSTFSTIAGKKVTYGVSLSGESLKGLFGDNVDKTVDMDEGKEYFEGIGMECK